MGPSRCVCMSLGSVDLVALFDSRGFLWAADA